MSTMKVSERFACRATGQNRSTQRRAPASTTVGDPDASLRMWLRDYAKNHPRWGFAARTTTPALRAGWLVIKGFSACGGRKVCAYRNGGDASV
jgi:putative transposase